MPVLKYRDPATGTYKDIYGLPGPTLPGGTTGQVLTKTSNTDGAVAWSTPTAGGSGADWGTIIKFSTMSGANDDAKLASAITAQQSVTLKGRIIVLDENRDYTFTQQVICPSGFSIMGSFRAQDQPRSSRPVANRVLLRMAGASSGKGWLKCNSGSTFGWAVSNLSIDADANSIFVDGSEDNGGVLWTASFRDISIQNQKSVFGSKTNTLLWTADGIDGWWNINNCRESAWYWGGSDFFSSPTIMLVDSPPSLMPFNENLMTFSFMSNAWIKNIYCTCDGHGGIKIEGSGSGTSNSVWIMDSVFEGRNANHPSPGAILRMNSGQAMLSHVRFAHGMGKPDLITNRVDKGIIHVAGGDLVLEGCTYERGNTVTAWTAGTDDPTVGPAVPYDTPFVYVAAGAKVRVRNIRGTGLTSGGTSWGSNKPVVKQAVAGLADCDDSVTLLTAQTATVLNTGVNDWSNGFANTGTAVTINKPVALQDNVLLVAAVVGRNNSAAYSTPPSGWAEQAPSTDNISPGVLRFYTKQITTASSEPASYTWSGGASGRHNAVIVQVTGAPTSSPVDVKGAISTVISGPDRVIVPAVTNVADLNLLIVACQASATGGLPQTFVPGSSGTTLVGSSVTNTGASESALTVLFQSALGTGTSGTRSIPTIGTVVASTGSGFMMGVKSLG